MPTFNAKRADDLLARMFDTNATPEARARAEAEARDLFEPDEPAPEPARAPRPRARRHASAAGVILLALALAQAACGAPDAPAPAGDDPATVADASEDGKTDAATTAPDAGTSAAAEPDAGVDPEPVCGAEGNACCFDSVVGYHCDAGGRCNGISGRCETCGWADGPCCANNACGAGACFVGVCRACEDGDPHCSDCGARGTRCCNFPGGEHRCRDGNGGPTATRNGCVCL